MYISLIGTKAQLVKMAPVMLEMDKKQLAYLFVLSGQHEETMEDLIEGFGLKNPDFYLDRSGEADTKKKLLTWLLRSYRKGIAHPQIRSSSGIIVHGDTLSTLLGAIIGTRLNIPVIHVEAGLRSHNYFHPFPEEIVRVLVSKLSSIHMAPGAWAVNNLEKSHVRGRIVDTRANTLLDSLALALRSDSEIKDSKYCVVSLHRNENLSNDERFTFLMNSVEKISGSVSVKFVLHPVTRNKLHKTGWFERFVSNASVELVDRMDYFSFVSLLRGAFFLVTDGGSNQEEASYLGLPCLLMRKSTERVEGLDDNVVLSEYNSLVVDEFLRRQLSKIGSQRDEAVNPVLNGNDSPSSILVSALMHNG